MPHSQMPTQNTTVFPQTATGGLDMNDPKIRALLESYFQQHGGTQQWQV
jgi:hypothetical protein